MDTKSLKAEERKVTGRKVKKLRLDAMLPGNVYGKGVKSLAVSIPLKDFQKIYAEVGETGLIELTIGKEVRPVLVHNLQVHPVSGDSLHVDLRQVDLKEKVEAEVPVELIGESPAEKQGLGTVVQQLTEIKVEALPTDLPEKFEIDRSELVEVDQAVFVKDLKVDRNKVTVLTDAEGIVAKVEPPQKEEVVEAPAPVEGEVPAEGAPAEGQAPTEGGTETPAGEEKPKE